MTSDEESVSMYNNKDQQSSSSSSSNNKLQRQEHVSDEASHGWTLFLILAAATCGIGSAIPAGMNIAVINNSATILKNFCNESIKKEYNIDLSDRQLTFVWSCVVSVFLAGGVTGSIITSWIADKYGRKGALAIGNVFGIIGGIFFFIVPTFDSVILLMIGRLIVGLSSGITTSILPMYMTEVSPIAQRGAAGVICQLGITTGVFIGQIISLESILGTNNLWHIMLAAFVPLCFLSFPMLYILPESPKYLYVMKNQKDKAIKELCRLRNVQNNLLIHDEIYALQEEAAIHTTMDIWTVSRVLKDSTVRLPLLLVLSMQFGQQLSGINSVFFYSNVIFEKAQLSKTTAQYGTLGTGIINIGIAIASVYLMSNFGRRTLFLCSCYVSAASLVALSIGIYLISSAGFMSWICMAAVLNYVLFYGVGLGPIPFFIGSEIFEVAPRPAAMALGSVSNWGGNLMVGLLFPSLEEILGPFTFLIFVAFMLFVATFVRLYLPETRGKNTTDVTSKLTRGFKSSWQV